MDNKQAVVNSIDEFQQRVFIKFACLLDWSVSFTHSHLVKVLGKSAYPENTVKEWMRKIKSGHYNSSEYVGGDRSDSTTRESIIIQVKEPMDETRHWNKVTLSSRLGASKTQIMANASGSSANEDYEAHEDVSIVNNVLSNEVTNEAASHQSPPTSSTEDTSRSVRKKRPPTPPRKPNINRSKMPLYPFRGPLISTPSNQESSPSTCDRMLASTTSLTSSSNSYGQVNRPLIDISAETRIEREKITETASDPANANSMNISIINVQPYISSSLDNRVIRRFEEKQDAKKLQSSFHVHGKQLPPQAAPRATESLEAIYCTNSNSHSNVNSYVLEAGESCSSLEPETTKSTDGNEYASSADNDGDKSSEENTAVDETSSSDPHYTHHIHLVQATQHPTSVQCDESEYDLTYDIVAGGRDNEMGGVGLQGEEEDEEEEVEEDIYDTVAPDEVSVDENHSNGEQDEMSREVYRPEKESSVAVISGSKYINSDSDMNSFANYVNIDYFLRREETSSKNDSDDNETQMSHSMSSEHEIDIDSLPSNIVTGIELKRAELDSSPGTTYDEVFEPNNEAYYGTTGSDGNTAESPESETLLNDDLDEDEEVSGKTEAERQNMYKCILSSIIDSETVYVDCLNTLIQYRKALKSTTESAHPLLSTADLDAIFHKIQDLYNIHIEFLNGVKRLFVESNPDSPTLGDLFKVLASRLEAYSAYLKNYSLALETVQRCSSANNQFSEITRAIKLKSMKSQSVTLEELLHKPVARVQKNALILYDLLKYTHPNTLEYRSLRTALKMTQVFLNELNIAATEQMFPVQDKTQRRLVKESFVIELSEGRRKLRHLFLFNDTIVCAKYKPSTRQKFTFDVKWYALLSDVLLPETEEDPDFGPKEKELGSEIRNLRSKVSSIRDAIYKEKAKNNIKILEKLRKKLSDHEGQLVLILPQLPFVISHKSGKSYSFFLSSEFERTQWIESIRVLQQSASSSIDNVNFNELQAWIETCRKGLSPSLGSFLMRSSKDEDLLHGDLYLTIGTLQGIKQPSDIFFVIEVDTYGHFFQKASTKPVQSLQEHQINQDFSLDLDGSSNLRLICYEEVASHPKPMLRGKVMLELGRSWLKDKPITRELAFSDCKLSITLKFISSEASTVRFPAGKVYGAFGVPICQVAKKEKSNVPYLIVGCVKEVERRGVKEVGIYRVSGLSSDIQRLKKAFETNPYEAEHLLKEIDIHAITGLLKMYLRELPEALFTNSSYKKFFDAFSLTNQEERKKKLTELFHLLPPVNMHTINFLIDHFVNVNKYESFNKMSLHNLATVFGPTLIRPGSTVSGANNSDTFTAGTIDVMAQAGILYFFLKKRTSELVTN